MHAIYLFRFIYFSYAHTLNLRTYVHLNFNYGTFSTAKILIPSQRTIVFRTHNQILILIFADRPR